MKKQYNSARAPLFLSLSIFARRRRPTGRIIDIQCGRLGGHQFMASRSSGKIAPSRLRTMGGRYTTPNDPRY